MLLKLHTVKLTDVDVKDLPKVAILACTVTTWSLVGVVCALHLGGRAQVHTSIVYPLVFGALVTTSFPFWVDQNRVRSTLLGMIAGWLLPALAAVFVGFVTSGYSNLAKAAASEPFGPFVFLLGLPPMVGIPIGGVVGLITSSAIIMSYR